MTFFKGNLSTMMVSIKGKLSDAMEAIDIGARQTALVIDDAGCLVGVITDGDVRRSLIKGMTIDHPLADIANADFVSLKSTVSTEVARQLMISRNLHQIPLVDEAGCPVDIYYIDDLLDTAERDTRVVLMAGGLGTRLRPLTETVPKPMLHVGDRPILEKIINTFVGQNFTNLTISLNYKGEMIRDHFGDGSDFGANIEYIEEKQRMGTAGALSLLSERPTSPFIVMNGDLLTSLKFENIVNFHHEVDALATMCVREYSVQIPYGVVETEGFRLKRIVEKPTHSYYTNAGIYVMSPEALDHIEPETYVDMPCLFERMVAAEQPAYTFPLDEYWIDIGRMEDLERARNDVTGGEPS